MDNLQALVIDDFSGGMTDFIVGADPRQNEIVKNMVIDQNRDCIIRPGSRPKFEYRIASNKVPRLIAPYLGEFLVQATDNLYFMDTSSATKIDVVGKSYAFLNATSSSQIIQNFWNDNIVFTSEDLIFPLKCWKNQSSTYKLERLGMPHILLTYLIRLANDLKTKYNAHIVSLTEHSATGVTNAVTSPNATDLESLLTLTNELLADYEAHLSHSAIHPGAVASSFRLEERSVTTIFGAANALANMKAKYNLHDDDAVAHTLGAAANQVTVDSTLSEIVSSAGGTGNNYIYALHYKYTYQTTLKTFIENSDVLYVEISNVGAPNANNITIDLPVLTALDEYNVADIKVAIYRTFNNGQSFFKLDEVPASQSTYVDAKSDTDIENNAPLYTEGGVLPDEPPPKSKFSVIVNDTLVLGYIKDGTLTLPNFIQFSKQGRLYSCPSSFRQEFEEDVTGLGYVNVYPIVFLRNKVYRVEGSFDSFGKGFTRKRLISDSIGSINHKSIVNTKIGVFFAGPDGFYFTDGFNTKKISTDLNETYRALATKGLIEGTYDKLNNRVMWSAKADSSNTYNDVIYVAHLDYPTPKDGYAFTFFNGGTDVSNFLVSGIGFDSFGGNNDLLRLDSRGYLIYHNESFTDDTFINTAKTPDNWDTTAIIYQIDSVALDFGNARVRKWVPKININALNASALSLQIQSANDNTGQYVNLTKITDQSNISWGDPTVIWGEDTVLWNLLPIISQWRYFPAILQSIRCMYKQVRFTNAYIEIDDSSIIGPCSVDGTANTATLLSHPAQDWISEGVNYYISFAHEDYAFEYKITNINAAVLTLDDGASTLTNSASTAWKIMGYKKGEVLSLSTYVLSFNPISMTQATEQGATP